MIPIATQNKTKFSNKSFEIIQIERLEDKNRTLIFLKLKISKIFYNVKKDFLLLFLFSLSIEEIDDSRGLDSGKINTDENLISAVETSMDDDE